MANLTSDFDYNAAHAANTTAAGSPVESLVRIRIISAKGLKNTEASRKRLIQEKKSLRLMLTQQK